MFSHPLPFGDDLLEFEYHKYAKRHFLKRFESEYKGKQWLLTSESIKTNMKTIRLPDRKLQFTNQVDELWQKDDYWIFKYDFKIACTVESTKSSGNRCIVFLDNIKNQIEILLIFGKGDLPKNKNEQSFVEQTLNSEFSDYMKLVR